MRNERLGMKYSMTLGIALVCVVLFAACDNILDSPEIHYGRINISFAGEEAAPYMAVPQMARTVLPSTTFYHYTYTFTKTGEQTGVVKVPDNDGFFTLEIGSYTVAVQAFIGNAEPYTLAATGVSSQFSVGSGSNDPVKVGLTGVGDGAQGEFSYTITYPANADAEIILQKWPGLDDITLYPVNIIQGNGKTQTFQLDTGSYLLTVLISKDALYAGTNEAVHIYPSLTTVYTKDFNDDDFLKSAGAVVAVPILDTRTYNSITINAVAAPDTGQDVEYGISISSNAVFAAWQSGLTFSALTSGTTYYIFARSAQNTNYNAGAVSGSLTVKTSPHSIILYPRGQLNTYLNVPNTEKIRFRAVAYRDDGTIIENASGFVYSDAGVNASDGVFTPQTAGNITITVSLDGTSTSANVTVHPTDYMRQPYYYPGTGKTYQGFSDGTIGNLTTNGGVTVTYPAQATFSADGFFTLEGSVNNSAVYHYAYIQLGKDSDPDNLRTYYLVRNNFKQRIWLRFGAGAYTVSVYGMSSITLSSELGAEGAFRTCSLLGPGITFNVNNTRSDDSSVDYTIPDKRFIYPSYVVQSDDFRITNLAADLTYGLDNTAKIKAIHDYIVTNTVYDYDSIREGWRKKQDALTVLGRRYTIDSQYNPGGHFLAVCEGYTNTFAALARAAGIEVKYATSESMNHAWNHVYNSGWKFIDVTWGDPVRTSGVIGDFGPSYVRYTYYLLDSLYGVNNDHYGWEVDNKRAVIGSTVPRQRGVPDGWY